MEYYLDSAAKQDPAEPAERAKGVCDTYFAAPALAEQGVTTLSTDEKTGMQALERAGPTLPMKPGLPERQESEYIRHGTLVITANFDVVTGMVVSPTIAETRNEEDFAGHIARTLDAALAPLKGCVFVVDQLNTHMSETLVRLVARRCGITEELGVKGKEGILEDMAGRRKFLENKTHAIRFVYTPKHASWLNQVELWFSILARRFLKRGSFTSKEDLKTRLEAFIKYFNETLAKPFRWTYKGTVLRM